MNKRTANIIGLCKGNSKRYTSESIKQNISDYISNECMLSNGLTDEQIDNEIIGAFIDFVDSVDKPSSFLTTIFNDSFNKSLSITNRIIVAFARVQIKDGDTYMNGFSKELIIKMNEDLELIVY